MPMPTKKIPIQGLAVHLRVERLLKLLWYVFRATLILGLSFMILYPILVKLAMAVKSLEDLLDPTVFLIAKRPTMDNIKRVVETLDYVPGLIRTFMFSSANALLQTAACTVTGYGLARFKFKGRRLCFALVMITLVVPPQTVLLPLYLQFQHFSLASFFTVIPPGSGVNLTKTYLPYVFMSMTGLGLKNGLFIYMMRQNFINMPVALEEAAYIDGCNSFKTFYAIMLPNALTMMVTVGMFSFVWIWNDNLYLSFFVDDIRLMATAIIDIGREVQFQNGDVVVNPIVTEMYNNIAVVLQILPLLLVYVFAQRHFVQSVERSGIVG